MNPDLVVRNLGARWRCVAGHLEYYRKWGFGNVPGLVHEGVPPEVFFALSCDGRIPRGNVACHEAC